MPGPDSPGSPASTGSLFVAVVRKMVLRIILTLTGSRNGVISDEAFQNIFGAAATLLWCSYYGFFTFALWNVPIALLFFYLLHFTGYLFFWAARAALEQNGLVHYLPRGLQMLLLETYAHFS
jgi:hypothetical protein